MRDFVNYYLFTLIVFTAPDMRISRGQQSKCEKNPALGKNTLWKCTDRTKCAAASALPLNNTIHCGSGKICCPEARPRPVNRKTNGTTAFAEANQIALKKCYEYADYRYRNYTIPGYLIFEPPIQKNDLECRKRVESLIGGYYIDRAEFPHSALLGYDEDVTPETEWLCGGSLVSDMFILSAAHCTKTAKGELVKWAALGVIHQSDITEAAKGTSILRIKERFNHPSYKAGKSTYENNDIALYRLEKHVTFSPFIRPICIHFQSSLAVHTSAVVIGWDMLIDGLECMMIQIGITSRGLMSCGDENSPTIYTRVSTYLPWIQKIVWPEKAST